MEARSGQDWVLVRGSTQRAWSEDLLCLIVRSSCVVVKLKVWVLAFQPHSTLTSCMALGCSQTFLCLSVLSGQVALIMVRVLPRITREQMRKLATRSASNPWAGAPFG